MERLALVGYSALPHPSDARNSSTGKGLSYTSVHGQHGSRGLQGTVAGQVEGCFSNILHCHRGLEQRALEIEVFYLLHQYPVGLSTFLSDTR